MTDALVDSPVRPRVLCVDDDRDIAMVLSRVLRNGFEVVTAESAAAALALIRSGPPFAVVVSDYRMPHTDGVTLLGWVRDLAPDTVRILLTGNGDLDMAVDAVNRGHIFRFLQKPCAPDAFRTAVTLASEQHQLITSERVLLAQTVRGSVKALTDVLALAQPDAFGRATRVRRYALALAEHLGLRDSWPIEIAAMLSQVGCAALPSETVERYYSGGHLSEEERAVIASLPATAERLIADIPRLDAVREILRFQNTQFDGSDARGVATRAGVAGEQIPLGARMLKIILDFDLLEMHGLSTGDVMSTMRTRVGWYDPTLLAAFAEQHGAAESTVVIQTLRLANVRVGMVFAADVRGDSGMLLVARGQEVNVSLTERIRHQWRTFANRYEVSMLVPMQS